MLPTTEVFQNEVPSCCNSLTCHPLWKEVVKTVRIALCTLRKLAEPALTYLDISGDFSMNPVSCICSCLLLLLLLSHFSHVRLCATPWTAAQQAPLSLGFSRQEH